MKPLPFVTAVAFLLLGLPGVSRGALNFANIGDSATPVGFNPIGGFDSSATTGPALITASSGTLTFVPDPAGSIGPASGYADITLNNTGSADIGTWLIRFSSNTVDIFPAFTPVDLVVSLGGSSFTLSPANTVGGGAQTYVLRHTIVGGSSADLRFAFSTPGPGSFVASVQSIGITAVVPEPSSALLLTGALGLFGGFFRRRRSLGAGTAV